MSPTLGRLIQFGTYLFTALPYRERFADPMNLSFPTLTQIFLTGMLAVAKLFVRRNVVITLLCFLLIQSCRCNTSSIFLLAQYNFDLIDSLD
jgi:hypothetical protein